MGVQEDNANLAALEGDPFIEGYRAWLRVKQFSSGTGADFLSSFTHSSGMAEDPPFLNNSAGMS